METSEPQDGQVMWEQYKRTFIRTQAIIWLVSLLMFALSRSWQVGATFLVLMQIGSVAGVMWGIRLRRLFFPDLR